MSERTTVFIQDSRIKILVEQLIEFNKIIDGLQNIEVKLDDENIILLLLSFLPIKY